MAETSGFFQAMADETTGEPDRRYLAKQFCDYFALFIGNGVFGSPTNQLIVAPGQSGLSVVVKPGNAFIDGMWYNNSSDKQIFIVPNYESQVRVDTVRVRMSQVTRAITVEVFTGDSDLQRGEDIYDLQLATINVQPFAETISAANIKDTRSDQSVCGFVTSLMSVQTTADLFAQYQAQFDEWFAGVQGTLGSDAAGNLLIKITQLDGKVDDLETKVDAEISEIQSNLKKTQMVQLWKGDNLSYDSDGCATISIASGNIITHFSLIVIKWTCQGSFNENFESVYYPYSSGPDCFVFYDVYNKGFYIRKFDFISNQMKVYPCRKIVVGQTFVSGELDSSKNGTSEVNLYTLRPIGIYGLK